MVFSCCSWFSLSSLVLSRICSHNCSMSKSCCKLDLLWTLLSAFIVATETAVDDASDFYSAPARPTTHKAGSIDKAGHAQMRTRVEQQ